MEDKIEVEEGEEGGALPNESHPPGELTKKSWIETAKAAWAWLKNFVAVFVFKFCLSIFDVASDLLNGISFITGSFGLGMYYLSEVRQDYDEEFYGPQLAWGCQTISLVWLPGLVRTSLIAADQNWRQMTKMEAARMIMKYLFLTLIWPVFTPFM